MSEIKTNLQLNRSKEINDKYIPSQGIVQYAQKVEFPPGSQNKNKKRLSLETAAFYNETLEHSQGAILAWKLRNIVTKDQDWLVCLDGISAMDSDVVGDRIVIVIFLKLQTILSVTGQVDRGKRGVV